MVSYRFSPPTNRLIKVNRPSIDHPHPSFASYPFPSNFEEWFRVGVGWLAGWMDGLWLPCQGHQITHQRKTRHIQQNGWIDGQRDTDLWAVPKHWTRKQSVISVWLLFIPILFVFFIPWSLSGDVSRFGGTLNCNISLRSVYQASEYLFIVEYWPFMHLLWDKRKLCYPKEQYNNNYEWTGSFLGNDGHP